MPKFYSELQNASLENLAADTTPGVAGRFFRNTVSGKVKVDNGVSIESVVTETSTATLTNKTLTSPTINTGTMDVMIMDGQVSTPANPSAGFYKVYVKDDGRAYILNPAGLEAGLGGGGGSGSLEWSEQANAPIKTILANMPVYEFTAALAQQLYVVINVPSSYIAGNQINLKLKSFNEDTSGTVLLLTTTILVRAEVDDYDSTTNTRVSTNAAITMTSANDKEAQKLTFDLTSSTGTVNSVAVAAGDVLIVRLYRDTDTATSPIYTIIGSEEVTLT